MKKIFRCAAIICLVATLLCALVLFAACDDGKGKNDDQNPESAAVTYEVTVLTDKNAPAVGAKVSFVEIEEGKTHDAASVSVNENGVASYKSEVGNPVDATLTDIPAGYKIAEEKKSFRLTKESASATVKLERADSQLPDDPIDSGLPDLDYSEPIKGSGTARYVGADSTQIESLSFDPYVIVEGNYKFKIANATERIYLQFNSRNSKGALYLIYSRGNADVSVQTIVGTTMGGLYNPTRTGKDNDGRPQFNDNKSAEDKNFELEFSNNESSTMGYTSEGEFYFEIALEDEKDAGIEFAVTVEKSDKPYVPKPPTQYSDVHATPAPSKAQEGEGILHPIPTNCSNFVVVKAADGTYHLGDEKGPLLYANLDGPWPCGATIQSGQLMTCILRTSGGTNPYKWVTTLSDDGSEGENWLPFLCEYVGYILDSDGTLLAPDATNENTGKHNTNASMCNSDGYYPLNEQIVKFLTLLYNDLEIQHFYFTPDNYMGSTWFLPEGYEWLFLCGYYGEEYKGADFGGKGTSDEPYALRKAGTYEVSIPAGGKLYFSTGLSYELSSQTAGAMLEVDGTTLGSDGKGFAYTLNVDEGSSKTFAVYIKDGKAGSVVLSVEDAQLGDGTLDDPYQKDAIVGSYSAKATADKGIWYTFQECAGKYFVTTSSADVTIEIYDLDGYMALSDREEASPIASIKGAAGTFEISGNEYFLVVRCAATADIAWEISKIQ